VLALRESSERHAKIIELLAALQMDVGGRGPGSPFRARRGLLYD
jgi:hypothetical protein